ncbi:hypothetical protein F0562_003614 [Nyssa sinensis]|uniref:VQ domain-containing protein n=1 Tax=Nyssa sinensis TaxID=561372 RepID=A0A5J5BZU0_9ASTE|nr:hypothetical protein F0562_003614 [Nyssa sinensis]
MGKKLSQSSLKITKNDKKQLNSLVKVLRPKVYITDSSSFKRLVQELTGNSISISSPPPTILPPVGHVPDIEIEDHGYQESNSVDLSVDSSKSVPTPFAAPESSPELSMLITTNQMDFAQYRDIESWLLEMEPFPYYYDSYAPPLIQQEV